MEKNNRRTKCECGKYITWLDEGWSTDTNEDIICPNCGKKYIIIVDESVAVWLEEKE